MFTHRFNRRYAIRVIKRLMKIADFDTLVKPSYSTKLDQLIVTTINFDTALPFYPNSTFLSVSLLHEKISRISTTKVHLLLHLRVSLRHYEFPNVT